jgi:sulfur relay (sulfurtransferase) complex TusBCD TusD component (DsrE family)
MLLITVMAKKLGILLSTPPSHRNLQTVLGLTDAALQGGTDVYLYLIDEGTRNFHEDRLRQLSGKGLKLFVCAYGAQNRGIFPSDEAVFGGLAVLGELINNCDRFISFN